MDFERLEANGLTAADAHKVGIARQESDVLGLIISTRHGDKAPHEPRISEVMQRATLLAEESTDLTTPEAEHRARRAEARQTRRANAELDEFLFDDDEPTGATVDM